MKTEENLAKELIAAVTEGRLPTPAACFDFCISDLKKYEAVFYPIKNQEITFDQLVSSICDGRKMTALVNSCQSNPHKGIEFKTMFNYSYIDNIMNNLHKHFKK
jgi:hypothetical protein